MSGGVDVEKQIAVYEGTDVLFSHVAGGMVVDERSLIRREACRLQSRLF